jgi:hypothetical protein
MHRVIKAEYESLISEKMVTKEQLRKEVEAADLFILLDIPLKPHLLIRGVNQGFGNRCKKNGYIVVKCPFHPRAQKYTGYVYEHLLVAEKKMGRPLHPNELVHHKDKNKSNNDPQNLKVMTKGAHASLHSNEYWDKMRKIRFLEIEKL